MTIRLIKRHVIKLSLALFYLLSSESVLAINAYVLAADEASGNTIVDSLTVFQIDAQLGVSPSVWDGSQIDLEEIDVVILLSRDEDTPLMPTTGQQAIIDFVNNGGGLITGGLAGTRIRKYDDYELLQSLFPFIAWATVSGNGARYFVETSNGTLQQDLVADVVFQFAEPGIELYEELEGSIVYYRHQTPGLDSNQAGLVGWEYGEGQVLSFNTKFLPFELENSLDLTTLLRNAVTFAANEITEEELCMPIKANAGIAIICL